MTEKIQFNISTNDAEVKDILVALLSDAGADGFEEEAKCLKAFCDDDPTMKKEMESIIAAHGLNYAVERVAEKNWNEEWERNFQPVAVENFCAIRASFHPPVLGVQHDIIITPKMSFGTGHHATTWLMVQAMQGLSFGGKRVFDFGTGTGVLAILAAKMGAETITAIDNDEWSIANAAENFISNNCSNVLLINAHSMLDMGNYDVILANINRNIILDSLGAIQQHLAKDGVVLLSGLLAGDEEVIAEAGRRRGLVYKHKTEMNGWICLLMVNP